MLLVGGRGTFAADHVQSELEVAGQQEKYFDSSLSEVVRATSTVACRRSMVWLDGAGGALLANSLPTRLWVPPSFSSCRVDGDLLLPLHERLVCVCGQNAWPDSLAKTTHTEGGVLISGCAHVTFFFLSVYPRLPARARHQVDRSTPFFCHCNLNSRNEQVVASGCTRFPMDLILSSLKERVPEHLHSK